MSSSRLWTSAAIIALVILIVFALSVPHTRDIAEKPPLVASVSSVPTVAINDSFKKGLHTITGSIEAPNVCAVVSASAALSGNSSSTESILISISLQSDPGVCLQMPTRMNFQTTVSARASVPITATVNGLLASTTPL